MQLPLAFPDSDILSIKETAFRLHEKRRFVRAVDAKFKNLLREALLADREGRELIAEVCGRECK